VLDQTTIDKLTRRGVAEIILEQEFIARLQEGKPLRLKMGFDPSRPDIHLGHVVGLRKLRQLQELGHQVILIVGDWTAQIGDPSGQSATRPMLTHEQVVANAESYMRQFFKVVDRERTQVEWQSQWFGKFTLADVLRLTSRFTVAQILARDDFAKRFKENRPLAVTELLYPLLQAYDSVAIRADVEFGGTDQKFNLLVGRELQGMVGQRPQQCFTVPILVGTDGVQKMSKSLDNYIGVDEPPYDMYGKVMSIGGDDLIVPYFELLTDVPDAELKEMRQQIESQSVNPMLLKKRLAREIVTEFHNAGEANAAEERFASVRQKKEVPKELQGEVKIGVKVGAQVVVQRDIARRIVEAGLADSVSEATRLIAQGAVTIDGQKLSGSHAELKNGSIIKVGKRGYLQIIDADNWRVTKA